MKIAIILIPGIMGSVLEDNGKIVWPGSILELMRPYNHMDSLRKPDLVATDVIRSFSLFSQYDNIIDSLEKAGFQEGSEGNLRVFPYDWRKDNELAATALADLIDQFAASLGPDYRITLLAHSMGGLIGRCYLESGIFSNRPGFTTVASLITMGTPHRGAPMALSAAVGLEKRLFLSAEQVQEIANNDLFPSLYQLLPPQHEPFAWNRDVKENFKPEDIYEVNTAKKLGLSKSNLEAAQRFHKLLDLARRPLNVRYFFFAGTKEETTSGVQLVADGTRFSVMKMQRSYSGDGTVPFWSGSQSGIQTEPVSGEHGTIYQGRGLKLILGGLLGKRGVLATETASIEISVNPPVVNLESTIRVTINLPIGNQTLAGVIRLCRVVATEGLAPTGKRYTTNFQVNYSGPEIDHLTIVMKAPEYAGIYEVGFALDTNAEPLAKTTLVVQLAS
ncbi:hypothetical protein LSO07_15660 [Janthinobacterium sp. PLB04]|uniref:Lecithin:cholesterol acyltransferase n=1 Tax=Janthinobacterium lividum TaxID=29581 RepID=A0AAJ4T392_9BURK|nr:MULTISPECIES: hypothetical protein [Janthinobacterium]KAB0325100.1 hypothetical protein F3B38_15565 [Janthinobacterium lividum]QSX94189.1 hypothetical protein J3P46_15645 [Janthinobacterium lividum]UGQ33957.1 hypothetical protein LSO07_15660 [Janthinobacterium sp. PLB04]